VCNYDDWGNALIGNTFSGNGFFGNDTNGDFAESTSTPGEPINCYSGKRRHGGGGDQLARGPSADERELPAPERRGQASAAGGPAVDVRSVRGGAGEPVVQRAGGAGPVLPATGRCTARFVTVGLTLAKRERFRSLSVKIGRGRWQRHTAHGRRTAVQAEPRRRT
jgi:hypothetical protein